MFAVGQRVVVETVRGLRGGWESLDVEGVVEAIEKKPWGTDAKIRLTEPTYLGNIDCNLEVSYLSLSTSSPNLRFSDVGREDLAGSDRGPGPDGAAPAVAVEAPEGRDLHGGDGGDS